MPDWTMEDENGLFVCGIDEAGRGPWVGPVSAAAVMFLTRDIDSELLSGINDSKKLSTQKREKLYNLLLAEAEKGRLVYGIGMASSSEIDELNILQATFLAMRRAVEQMTEKPRLALIDGNRLPPNFCCPTKCFIGGDARSYSIAAASILAKVWRDAYMRDLAVRYPYYGFEKNAGYGTKEHITGIEKYGIISEHRRSYKPIREFLMQQDD